jgi:hypothetical protein
MNNAAAGDAVKNSLALSFHGFAFQGGKINATFVPRRSASHDATNAVTCQFEVILTEQIRTPRTNGMRLCASATKKTDVAKRPPRAIRNVGLLDNKPTGLASLLFI